MDSTNRDEKWWDNLTSNYIEYEIQLPDKYTKEVIFENTNKGDTITTNYYHVEEMTYEQKVEMFMKLDKLEIINMLIECNRHI